MQNYDATKCLSIVGECGQPLVNISGIKFARADPTNKEIELAVSLLDSFLSKHLGDIGSYLSLRQKLTKMNIPILEDNANQVTYAEAYFYNKHNFNSAHAALTIPCKNGEIRS